MATEECKIGDKIRQLRKKRLISQEQLAERIGISQTYLSDLELNKFKIDAEDLIKISRVLDYPITQFLPCDVVGDQRMEEVGRYVDGDNEFITYKRPKRK